MRVMTFVFTLTVLFVGFDVDSRQSGSSAAYASMVTQDPPPEHEGKPETTTEEDGAPASPAVKTLRREALKLGHFVKADWVRQFLAAPRYLPDVTPRKLYYDRPNRKVYSETEAEALSEEARAKLTNRTRDGEFYYNTKYGSPLAYARALDVLAAEGFELRPGMKIADFGYGTIGHLKLLACLGAEVVGIDVDPELRALYSEPGDQGPVHGAEGVTGSVRLVHGYFPSDDEVQRAVGTGYDLFISKNVLKHGYVHPARPVDKRRLLNLGVEDRVFVQTLFDMLKPGGYALIYNICPPEAAPDEPYIPWADGRSPFPEKMYESVGFRVLVFDRDDSKATRKMARRLGWDAALLKKGLFAWYTILKKPRRP